METKVMATREPTAVTNQQTVTWERLEVLRLQKLGLSNKYSRHFNVLRRSMPNQQTKDDQIAMGGLSREYALEMVSGNCQRPDGLKRSKTMVEKSPSNKSNSIAPFATVGKPTCGYFFSRETDNRKLKIGIPPSDLVKWRHFGGSNN